MGSSATAYGYTLAMWSTGSVLFHAYEPHSASFANGTERAGQTLRKLAQKIGDEELREGFLSAPQASRVLERS